MLVSTRDVNGAGRVRIVALLSYPLDKYLPRTCTHIHRVSIMRVSVYIFHIRGIHRYSQNYLKNKYLIINSNKIK